MQLLFRILRSLLLSLVASVSACSCESGSAGATGDDVHDASNDQGEAGVGDSDHDRDGDRDGVSSNPDMDGGPDAATEGPETRDDAASPAPADGSLPPDGDGDAGITDAATDDAGGVATGERAEGYRITKCSAAVDAEAADGCEQTRNGDRAVLLQGTLLLPYEVLLGGELVIDERGFIACAACDCSAAAEYESATRIACRGAVISPGLVDPHVHLAYGNQAPVDHGDERYDHRHDWRTGRDGATQLGPLTSSTAADAMRASELRHLIGGTTTVAGSGSVNGLVRNRDRANSRAGAPVPGPWVDLDSFPLGDSGGAARMTDTCDYSQVPTDQDLAGPRAYLPHVAEGIGADARNEFSCMVAGATEFLGRDTSVVQGIALTATDAAQMAGADVGLVWSPRSNISLYGQTAAVTVFDRLGVRLALGSDWSPTGSMNLLRELKCAADFSERYLDDYFSDFQLWHMATAGGARALGLERALGRLSVGAVGDVSVFMGDGLHRAVVEAGDLDVALVLRGGRPLYGRTALLEGNWVAGAGCTALSLCGDSRRLCADDELGGSGIADLASAAGGFPFAACEVPDAERSCVPRRDAYPDGITASDADGDGVDDASDNCPRVFNPPMGGSGGQANTDGDAAGDACDRCPLDELDACAELDPDDPDGDGVTSDADSCPHAADASNADADGDGHGDACDDCTLPNVGAASCVTALGDAANPRKFADGTPVWLEDFFVTAVRPAGHASPGFYMHLDGSTAFAGLFVGTMEDPAGVSVGNRVSVRGIYAEQQGLQQLGEAEVFIKSASTTLPFGPVAVVDPARIAPGGDLAQAYQGMLVTLNNVTITDDNPDSPDDFDEFQITGALRVDDELNPAQGNDCPLSTSLDAITGVLSASGGVAKLLPRSAQDITGSCAP